MKAEQIPPEVTASVALLTGDVEPGAIEITGAMGIIAAWAAPRLADGRLALATLPAADDGEVTAEWLESVGFRYDARQAYYRWKQSDGAFHQSEVAVFGALVRINGVPAIKDASRISVLRLIEALGAGKGEG